MNPRRFRTSEAAIGRDWRAFGKHSEKQERLPKNFITSAPAPVVGDALRTTYRAGDLSPLNKVVLLADNPGCFRVGVTYADDTEFTFADGTTGHTTGEPLFVFEVHYRPHGPGTHGYFVWTLLPDEPDDFEKPQIEAIPVWAMSPVYQLDPQMELIAHKDAAARGLATGTVQPVHLPGMGDVANRKAFAPGSRPDAPGPPPPVPPQPLPPQSLPPQSLPPRPGPPPPSVPAQGAGPGGPGQPLRP
ncbi:MAG: hypothetical protein WAW85_14350, partial [Gordonia sp. (in: high G+C Gram-positive bacteria)]|uniref:hypothetical protein n=1 Tax=Gordonia sp. (in: high G+C Gram-positive bacteria) TaxID=84139 RepID=UPI003BB53D05